MLIIFPYQIWPFSSLSITFNVILNATLCYIIINLTNIFFFFKESSCPPRPGSSSTTDDDLCMIGYMSARGDFVVVRINIFPDKWDFKNVYFWIFVYFINNFSTYFVYKVFVRIHMMKTEIIFIHNFLWYTFYKSKDIYSLIFLELILFL